MFELANTVQVMWLPGHTGVEGNEKADGLAKASASTPFIGPEPAFGISKQSIRTAVKK